MGKIKEKQKENVRIRPSSREQAKTVIRADEGDGAQEAEYKVHKIRMTFNIWLKAKSREGEPWKVYYL